MSDLKMDLDAEISKLETRWGELNVLYPNPPGPTADEKTEQRSQITFWMTQINLQVSALERIKTNKKAAQVTVRGLTPEEIDSAKKAMSALNKEIKKAQTFNQILTTVTAILNGANTVISTASRA